MHERSESKYIIEFLLTLIFLYCGLVFADTNYFVASGLFAIAMQIGMLRSDNNE